MFRFYSKDTDKMKRTQTPGYIGIEPVQTYYRKYKNLDKEMELDPEGYSASTAYLSKIKSLKVLPSPLGLMQVYPKKSKEAAIKASNMKMGNTYALALSSSMKYLSNT